MSEGLPKFESIAKVLCAVEGDRRANLSRVSKATGLTWTTVIRVVEFLEQRGLIERNKEGREHSLKLTRNGKRVLARIKEVSKALGVSIELETVKRSGKWWERFL